MANKRAKVGDWVALFAKVVMLHGRSQLVVRIEGSEVTVNRSEVWNPDDDEVIESGESVTRPTPATRETMLREALGEALYCIDEFVDVLGNEWHDGTPLKEKRSAWRAALTGKNK